MKNKQNINIELIKNNLIFKWKKMGLPSSTWTISFGPPRVQKPSFVLGPIKKQSFVPDPKLSKKKK